MTIARLPHAVMDVPSRSHKGLKIRQMLDLSGAKGSYDLLEIGCGNGGISGYFARSEQPTFHVTAVDVIDNRVVTDGFNFILVNDASLPVSDASFDIVLSNHVIEHVGERPEQMRHLREIKRVLRRHGKAYLAVPNRWMLVEPHYQLAFLSWIPRSWRTPYLRVTGRGEVYDCLPLQMGELERMLAEAGLEGENVGVKAMHATFSIEKPQSKLGSFLANMPDRCLRWLNFAIPTHIYVIRHRNNESA